MGLSSVPEAIDTLKLKLNNLSGELSANLIIALGKLSDVLVSKYHQSELLNQVALVRGDTNEIFSLDSLTIHFEYSSPLSVLYKAARYNEFWGNPPPPQRCALLKPNRG
jgi:hypothetical protein